MVRILLRYGLFLVVTSEYGKHMIYNYIWFDTLDLERWVWENMVYIK